MERKKFEPDSYNPRQPSAVEAAAMKWIVLPLAGVGLGILFGIGARSGDELSRAKIQSWEDNSRERDGRVDLGARLARLISGHHLPSGEEGPVK